MNERTVMETEKQNQFENTSNVMEHNGRKPYSVLATVTQLSQL